MKFITDFHIHSHYSIATSKSLTPENIAEWAARKGIAVVGTGDFTHPGWYQELVEKLEPAEPGLFQLKGTYAAGKSFHDPGKTRFILTSEVSSIYKKEDRVRKVHNLIFAPNFDSVEKIQHELSKIGNITSDGRPILGLDSRDLLEITLSVSERCFFVPAHIWTPWFSVLGSGSGFSRISDCYGDLSHYIHAVETGLSSDPPMNRLCSFLDRYTLISNSDAHSPERLGRESNLFDAELSYDAITDTLKSGDPARFLGTVEFFPQEGKYHYDGHRKCGVRWNPVQTVKAGGICPVCGKKVTVGVMNRVLQLADREDDTASASTVPFYPLIPLKEILSEIVGTGPASKKVERLYDEIVQAAGSEFDLLIGLPLSDVEALFPDLLSEAIRRMRAGDVHIEEGFDGEYGKVRVFGDGEVRRLDSQKSLFTSTHEETSSERSKRFSFDPAEFRVLSAGVAEKEVVECKPFALDVEQARAKGHGGGAAIVIAGPGTGKTEVLTSRIARLILEGGADPAGILALTFTNKAADEMLKRVRERVKATTSSIPSISTFHRFGLGILRTHAEKLGRTGSFSVVEPEQKRYIFDSLGCERRRAGSISNAISLSKQHCTPLSSTEMEHIAHSYGSYLKENNLFDLDDLVSSAVELLSLHHDILLSYRERYRHLLVDEYQDLNHAQYRMVRLLAPSSTSDLFVIGDPNQAIYGFRGASSEFFERFIQDYPDATVHRLNKSYRCSSPILKGSREVIQGIGKPAGHLFLQGQQSDIKIKIVQHRTDRSEAEWVARTIESMMGGLRFFSMDSGITEGSKNTEIKSLSDFAVLVRIRRQMEVIKKAFGDHSIPYQEVTHLPLFSREPARTIVELLRLSMNPNDRLLKTRVEEKGSTTVADVCSLLEGKSTVEAKVGALIDRYYPRTSRDEERTLALICDLASKAISLESFLDDISIGTEADSYDRSTETVSLLTLHASKGLEFTCVFILGCEDGLIPYSLYTQGPTLYTQGAGGADGEEEIGHNKIQEELRLLYVGMTRAKSVLYLSHSSKRYLFGREYRLNRSPYIDPIEDALAVTAAPPAGSRSNTDQPSPGLQLDLF
jgi:DNA helicase-2/ATP-dependent DNA helicase PcrA